ncbi:hypothetical protein ACGFNQ_08840 [Streptomyces asoensis]|uniref:hypothetical protein n=1 Tax=Streptomyces asoensis TaxID=249586 RepID=UPI00371CF890
MPRDLDGYLLPDSPDGPDRRRTTWRPEGFELHSQALAMKECQCPCRIAHPQYLVEDCEHAAKRVAIVGIGTVGMSQYILPLCAVCAAAQLHGRWRKASRERDGWRVDAQSIGQFAVITAVVGTLVGAPLGYLTAGVWLGVGVGIAAAYVAYERWSYERRMRQ